MEAGKKMIVAAEETRLRTELLLLPLVGPKLVKLTQNGVTEQDIIDIAAVFETGALSSVRPALIDKADE